MKLVLSKTGVWN